MNITILVFWVYYNWNPFSGIDDNDTMKVFGKGGADIERNKPGDLYVTIKVREDPIFRREGNHVHVDSVLSISQVNLVLLTFFWFAL